MSNTDFDVDGLGNDPELVAMFVSNATELLDQIEGDLLSIESTPEKDRPDLINKVFRAAHTVKGESGFVGLANIGRLAHAIEGVLDRMRDRELEPTRQIINTLLTSFDNLNHLVQNIESSEGVDLSADLSRLQKILDGGSSGTDSAPPVVVPASSAAPMVAVSVATETESVRNQAPQADKPAAPKTVRSDAANTNLPAADRNARRNQVLLIDDEPIVAHLATHALKAIGVNCDLASNCADALKLMRKNLYRVVICDLNLPGIHGIDLVRQIKMISPMAQIIVLTGDASRSSVIASLSAGAVDFIPKTNDYSILQEPVRDALNRARRWSPLLMSGCAEV